MERKIRVLVFSGLFILSIPSFAQKELKHTRQGNREYRDVSYENAELSYRRSLDENPEFSDAVFNLGDALYKQEKFDDALKSFSSLVDREIDEYERSQTYYNIGNTLLKNDKLKESIEAYKNSLRIDPSNKQAKYNLAYAQDKLQEQEQEQEEQEQDKDSKEENKDKENQDENQDSQPDGDNQEDQEDQNDNNEDQEQDKEGDKQNDQNQQDDRQMSKQDAERLLDALSADEQEVQEKVKKAKAARARVRTLKNW